MSLTMLAAFASAGAAAATQDVDCAGHSCVAGLSAKDLFALAAQEEAAGRVDEAERFLEALTKDPNIEYRSEARFRLGKLKEKLGDRQGALSQYRRLLDEKPDAQRVRLEVARLLALVGDEASARRELRRAQASGLPEDVARVVDQFAIALRSRRKLGGTFEIALAPDSNINTATDRQTINTVIADIPLSDGARQQSGIGLSLAGQGFLRVPVSGQPVSVQLAGRADLYRKSAFRDISASLTAGPEFQLGRARLRPALLLNTRFYGDHQYSSAYGATLEALAVPSRTSQIQAELSFANTRYQLNPAQNGTSYSANVTFERALSARFSGRIGTTAVRQTAADPGYASTSFGGDILLARQLGSLTVFGQAGLTRVIGDGRLFLFGATRRDTRWSATTGMLWRRWQVFGFSPVIRISHTQSRSSLDIYDYKRTRAEFALSRDL